MIPFLTHKRTLTALFAAALVLASCASTRVTSDWADPLYRKQPAKVVVMASAEQAADLRLVEEEFASRLKRSGVEAIPSFSVVPDARRGDKAAIEAKARELGADALLITRLVERKTERDYVPGAPYPHTGGYYHGPYGGYYGGYAGGSGYVTERTYGVAEANLHDLTTGKTVWSAVTETELRGDNREDIKSFVDVVVKSLQEKELIPSG